MLNKNILMYLVNDCWIVNEVARWRLFLLPKCFNNWHFIVSNFG